MRKDSFSPLRAPSFHRRSNPPTDRDRPDLKHTEEPHELNNHLLSYLLELMSYARILGLNDSHLKLLHLAKTCTPPAPSCPVRAHRVPRPSASLLRTCTPGAPIKPSCRAGAASASRSLAPSVAAAVGFERPPSSLSPCASSVRLTPSGNLTSGSGRGIPVKCEPGVQCLTYPFGAGHKEPSEGTRSRPRTRGGGGATEVTSEWVRVSGKGDK